MTAGRWPRHFPSLATGDFQWVGVVLCRWCPRGWPETGWALGNALLGLSTGASACSRGLC